MYMASRSYQKTFRAEYTSEFGHRDNANAKSDRIGLSAVGTPFGPHAHARKYLTRARVKMDTSSMVQTEVKTVLVALGERRRSVIFAMKTDSTDLESLKSETKKRFDDILAENINFFLQRKAENWNWEFVDIEI